MTKKTVAAIAFVTLSALPLFALRGRPLTQLRFGDQLTTSSDVATNGTDYLAVFSDGYGQFIRGGTAVAAAFFIADGTALSVAWSGSWYVVSSSNAAGVFVTRVSRYGGIIKKETDPLLPRPHDDLSEVTAGSAGTLLTALIDSGDGTTLVSRLLYLDGGAGPVVPLARNITSYAVTRSGEGFAVASNGTDGLSVIVIDSYGAVRSSTQIAPAAMSVAIGHDGEHIAVLFTAYTAAPPPGVIELETSQLASDGTMLREPATIMKRQLISGHNVSFGLGPHLIWSGSEFIAFEKDGPDSRTGVPDTALLRISPDLATLIERASGGLSSLGLHAAAARTGEILALANDWLWWGVATLIRTSDFQVLSRVPFGTVLSAQQWPSLAAASGQYLAAWGETNLHDSQIRATRIDSRGEYVDENLILAHHQSAWRTAVASDGAGWLVVWNGGASRISSSGLLLDEQPIETPGDLVVFGRDRYLIVQGGIDLRMHAVRPDGTVAVRSRVVAAGVPAALTTTTFSPSGAVWDGSAYVVSYVRDVATWTGGQPLYEHNVTTEVIRIDGEGAPLDQTPIVLPATTPAIALASDGARVLWAWSAHDQILGVILPRGSLPADAATPFVIADDPELSLASATFDSVDFVIALHTTGRPSRVELVHVSTTGIIGAVDRFDTADSNHSAAVSANATTPLAIVFDGTDLEHEQRNRVSLLLGSDLSDLTPKPPPPEWAAVAVSGDNATVIWSAVPGVWGYEIDVLVPDGGLRQIGIASASTTTATVTPAGIVGVRFAVRTWNGGGTSTRPTIAAPSSIRRRAAGH